MATAAVTEPSIKPIIHLIRSARRLAKFRLHFAAQIGDLSHKISALSGEVFLGCVVREAAVQFLTQVIAGQRSGANILVGHSDASFVEVLPRRPGKNLGWRRLYSRPSLPSRWGSGELTK